MSCYSMKKYTQNTSKPNDEEKTDNQHLPQLRGLLITPKGKEPYSTMLSQFSAYVKQSSGVKE